MSASIPEPLASFEDKWASAHRELPLALAFIGGSERALHSAFACLTCEIEAVVFAITDPEPAAVKLEWWVRELGRLAEGKPEHPLTRILVSRRDALAPTIPACQDAMIRAGMDRSTAPAPDGAALVDAYRSFHTPFAAALAALFPVLDAQACASVMALSRLSHDVLGYGADTASRSFPFPMDLLARHRLTRADLAGTSPAAMAAVREWLVDLAANWSATVGVQARTGPWLAAVASAVRWRVTRASRRSMPRANCPRLLARVPARAVFAAWRSARRMHIRVNELHLS